MSAARLVAISRPTAPGTPDSGYALGLESVGGVTSGVRMILSRAQAQRTIRRVPSVFDMDNYGPTRRRTMPSSGWSVTVSVGEPSL